MGAVLHLGIAMTKIDADKVQGEGSAVNLDNSAFVAHPDARRGFEEYTNRIPIKSITCRQRMLDSSPFPSASSSPPKILRSPGGARNPQYTRGSVGNLCTAGSGYGPEFCSLSANFSQALDCAFSVRSLQVADLTWFYGLPDSVLFAIRLGLPRETGIESHH